jgi:RNA-directed DNA polymerase
MYADRKSDASVVPTTQTNNTGTEPAAESAEERDAAKGNVDQSNLPRAPQRKLGRSHGLAGVRETARTQPELKFTSLMHHVTEDLLRDEEDCGSRHRRGELE